MHLGKAAIFITTLAALILCTSGPAVSDRSMSLNLCQELVNYARSFEARANSHNHAAENIMRQIEHMSRQPKSEASRQAIENYFAQYDAHRTMAKKLEELFRKVTEEANDCMESLR